MLHRERVGGSLTMFDRLIFKGYLTRLFKPGALRALLWSQGVPMSEYSAYVKKATDELVAHAERMAADAGRPSIYLTGTKVGGQPKDDFARQLAERDGITEGLVCVLRAVEPCTTFTLRRHSGGEIHAVPTSGRCLHLYFYVIDPEFGFMHVRVQSWMPYTVQVYVNGREWLARQLDEAGISYLRHDNALLRIDNLDAAWTLCDRFAHRSWPKVLTAFARQVNPHLSTLIAAGFNGYLTPTSREGDRVTEALLAQHLGPPPERDVDASPNLRDQHCQRHPPPARILKLDNAAFSLGIRSRQAEVRTLAWRRAGTAIRHTPSSETRAALAPSRTAAMSPELLAQRSAPPH
jgi:hypothetical protein